jgi:hypothetical protein
MKIIVQNRWFIFSSLIIVILLMLISRSINNGQIPSEILLENKDLIDVIISISEFILLMIAGIFTYLKFFKGHLFLSKVELISNATSVKLDSLNILHYLNIRIKNVGNFTISNPIIKVETNFYPGTKTNEIAILSKEEPQKSKVIRPNSIMSLPYKLELNKEVRAVEFIVTVEIENRKWSQSILCKTENEK